MSPLLRLENVNTHYGQAHILHDLSFDLKEGDVTALLGRNGAGKSTTMKSIIGLVPPTSGIITVASETTSGMEAFAIARLGVGYVPEERRVFSELTVMENLTVGRRPPRPGRPEWTPEALFALFPNLGRMKDRPGGQMSGGEQQMLTIARTLMGNPRLLLLDEPSEGLAPVIVEEMARTIQSLCRNGLTVLLSEQNLHFAATIATRALILERGHLRFDGPMQTVLSDTALRNRYLAV